MTELSMTAWGRKLDVERARMSTSRGAACWGLPPDPLRAFSGLKTMDFACVLYVNFQVRS